MHILSQSALALGLAASPISGAPDNPAPASVHTVDLNGDGQIDLLESGQNRQLRVSLGLGARSFQVVEQELPSAEVTDFLAADLDGDGFVDLYIVTPGANLALRGDGTGLLSDATDLFGLRDEGLGQSVELRDLDGDESADLLLRNQSGDVIFWAVPGGFERDVHMPFVPMADSVRALSPVAPLSVSFGALSPSHADDSSQATGTTTHGGRTEVSPTATPASPDEAQDPVAPAPLALTTTVPSSASLRSSQKFVAALSQEQLDILSYQTLVDLPDGLGGTVKTLRISGINVQIVNGRGATNGAPGAPDSIDGTVNGLGNLIIGYNELGNPNGDDRTGSHNLVVGHGHSFNGFGGLVAGHDNFVTESYSTVSGGQQNVASADHASVTGGATNTASGDGASISGGWSNVASGSRSSVSGGFQNLASGSYSSIVGGQSNVASNQRTSVSGGCFNTASGTYSSVSGGRLNVALATVASVSGGDNNLASGSYASVSGGRLNTASGSRASVSGGESNIASGLRASISGGMSNLASNLRASVSGGRLNTASGAYASVSGGQQNRATGSRASVTAGLQGLASGTYSSITGGQTCTASGSRAVVSGGATRFATGTWDWTGGSYTAGY